MTCSIPPLPHYSSTRTISQPVPPWPLQRISHHSLSQGPARSHTRSVANECKRIIQLSFRLPLPRPSPPFPTIGLPDSPGPIPVELNLSLRTGVPEIPMRPSEGCPNTRSNLQMNLALFATSYQMNRVPVSDSSFPSSHLYPDPSFA